MSERMARVARKEARAASQAVIATLAPDIGGVGRNEMLTRERVTALEQRQADLEARIQGLVASQAKFAAMSRLERFKWLLR